MNEAWKKFLKSLGEGQEVAQPEFTWGRVVSYDKREDENPDRSYKEESAQIGNDFGENSKVGWTYEVLDVVGTNVDCYDSLAHQANATRCEEIPHPDASDHWPVSLKWKPLERRNKRKQAETPGMVKRPIPIWLLEDEDFLATVDIWMEEWMKERPPGFRAIVEYTETVHTMAQEHLNNYTVQAKTAAHKLEVALAM